MLIAIDNGHGINTAGKRTPPLPDTGRVIREWEFNHATAKKLGELLKHNGFKVLYVSDTDQDTPLRTRTNLSNQAKADLFISIHYNALNGVWGTHGGIETFHHPYSKKGEEAAKYVQDELIKHTGLRNRGVKSYNFQVLRESNMPAVLVECGFMDNLEEAKLMIDENYQRKCARAMAIGICRFFGVTFKDLTVTENKPPEIPTTKPAEPQEIYSSWAKEAMQWAMTQGLTDGTNPKEYVNLERLITILYRYDKLK